VIGMKIKGLKDVAKLGCNELRRERSMFMADLRGTKEEQSDAQDMLDAYGGMPGANYGSVERLVRDAGDHREAVAHRIDAIDAEMARKRCPASK